MKRSTKSLSRYNNLTWRIIHEYSIDTGIEASKNGKVRNWIISILQQRARRGSSTVWNTISRSVVVLFLYRDYNAAGRKNPLDVMHSWVAIERKPFETVPKQGSCFRVNSIKISRVWKLWISAWKYPPNINDHRSWQREFIRLGGSDCLINSTSIKCKRSRLSIGFQ